MPQLTRITFHNATSLNRRWPYQASVMNTLEATSRTTVVTGGRSPLRESSVSLRQCTGGERVSRQLRISSAARRQLAAHEGDARHRHASQLDVRGRGKRGGEPRVTPGRPHPPERHVGGERPVLGGKSER